MKSVLVNEVDAGRHGCHKYCPELPIKQNNRDKTKANSFTPAANLRCLAITGGWMYAAPGPVDDLTGTAIKPINEEVGVNCRRLETVLSDLSRPGEGVRNE
jgi:hypothetical protein